MKKLLTYISTILVIGIMLISCSNEIETVEETPKAAIETNRINIQLSPVKGAAEYVIETATHKGVLTGAQVLAGETYPMMLDKRLSETDITVRCYGPNGGELGFDRVHIYSHMIDDGATVIYQIDPSRYLDKHEDRCHMYVTVYSDLPTDGKCLYELRFREEDPTPFMTGTFEMRGQDSTSTATTYLGLYPGEYHLTAYGRDDNNIRNTRILSMPFGIKSNQDKLSFRLSKDLDVESVFEFKVNTFEVCDSCNVRLVGDDGTSYETVVVDGVATFKGVKPQNYVSYAECLKEGKVVRYGRKTITVPIGDYRNEISCNAVTGEFIVESPCRAGRFFTVKTWPRSGGDSVIRKYSNSDLMSIPIPEKGEHQLEIVESDLNFTYMDKAHHLIREDFDRSNPLKPDFTYDRYTALSLMLNGCTADIYEVRLVDESRGLEYKMLSESALLNFTPATDLYPGEYIAYAKAMRRDGTVIAYGEKNITIKSGCTNSDGLILTSPTRKVKVFVNADDCIVNNAETVRLFTDYESKDIDLRNPEPTIFNIGIDKDSARLYLSAFKGAVTPSELIGCNVVDVSLTDPGDIEVTIDLKPLLYFCNVSFKASSNIQYLMASVDGETAVRLNPDECLELKSTKACVKHLRVDAYDFSDKIVRTIERDVALSIDSIKDIDIAIFASDSNPDSVKHEFNVGFEIGHTCEKVLVEATDADGRKIRTMILPEETIKLNEGVWNFAFTLYSNGVAIGKGTTSGYSISNDSVIPMSAYEKVINKGAIVVDALRLNSDSIKITIEDAAGAKTTQVVTSLPYTFNDIAEGRYTVCVELGWHTEPFYQSCIVKGFETSKVEIPALIQTTHYTYTVNDNTATSYRFLVDDGKGGFSEMQNSRAKEYQMVTDGKTEHHVYCEGLDSNGEWLFSTAVSTITDDGGDHAVVLENPDDSRGSKFKTSSVDASFVEYVFTDQDRKEYRYIVPAGKTLCVYYSSRRSLTVYTLSDTYIRVGAIDYGLQYGDGSTVNIGNIPETEGTVVASNPPGFKDESILFNWKDPETGDYCTHSGNELKLKPGNYKISCMINRFYYTEYINIQVKPGQVYSMDRYWPKMSSDVSLEVDGAYGNTCTVDIYSVDDESRVLNSLTFNSGNRENFRWDYGDWIFVLKEMEGNVLISSQRLVCPINDKKTDIIFHPEHPKSKLTINVNDGNAADYIRIKGKTLGGEYKEMGEFPNNTINLDNLEHGYWAFMVEGYVYDSSEPIYAVEEGISLLPGHAEVLNLKPEIRDNVKFQVHFRHPETAPVDVQAVEVVKIVVSTNPGREYCWISDIDNNSRVATGFIPPCSGSFEYYFYDAHGAMIYKGHVFDTVTFRHGMPAIELYMPNCKLKTDVFIDVWQSASSEPVSNVDVMFDNKSGEQFTFNIALEDFKGTAVGHEFVSDYYKVSVTADGKVIGRPFWTYVSYSSENRLSIDISDNGLKIENMAPVPPDVDIVPEVNGPYGVADSIKLTATVTNLDPAFGDVKAIWYVDGQRETETTNILTIAPGALGVGTHRIIYELSNGKDLYHVATEDIEIR